MAKIITATFKDGEVEVTLGGYKGKGCHAVQEAISKGMDAKTVEDKKLPEYNAVVTTVNTVKR